MSRCSESCQTPSHAGDAHVFWFLFCVRVRCGTNCMRREKLPAARTVELGRALAQQAALMMMSGGVIAHQDSQKAPGWQDASVSTPMGSLLCAVIGTAIHVRIPLLWNSCSQSCRANKQQLLFSTASPRVVRHLHFQHSIWSTTTS